MIVTIYKQSADADSSRIYAGTINVRDEDWENRGVMSDEEFVSNLINKAWQRYNDKHQRNGISEQMYLFNFVKRLPSDFPGIFEPVKQVEVTLS